jgi:hypothetical protein
VGANKAKLKEKGKEKIGQINGGFADHLIISFWRFKTTSLNSSSSFFVRAARWVCRVVDLNRRSSSLASSVWSAPNCRSSAGKSSNTSPAMKSRTRPATVLVLLKGRMLLVTCAGRNQDLRKTPMRKCLCQRTSQYHGKVGVHKHHSAQFLETQRAETNGCAILVVVAV